MSLFENFEYPFDYHIQRWSADIHSGYGSWSQITVGGTINDRKILGQPITKSFKLAGEAVCHDQPAQVHGAYNSGLNSTKWIYDSIQSEKLGNHYH
jgi:hypothetical protein